MNRLTSELKRRGVLKVAAAYALACWILIEAGSVLLPTFGAPTWVFRSYVIFVLLGFAVSLVAAWFFKITPDGLQREVEADAVSSTAITQSGSRRVNVALIAMLLVALGISISLNLSGRGSIVSDSVANDAFSIAVLPFTDISNDGSNFVFVDGIHDDLLTKLANVESMRVISRTSVMMYRGTTKNMRQIGQELGVGSILEGSVRRIGDNVRINMQLINASSDEHLWAQTYDRALTAKNIFDIQSEISTQIATALNATLSADEWSRLTAIPTENIEAYRLVTAGRQNLNQRLYETIVTARSQFEQAIANDPQYADAYVGLADSILLLNINHGAIPSDEAYPQVQAAIDKALQLNPMQAGAFATQGLLLAQQARHHSDAGMLAQAEENFKKALKLNPSNARAWMWYSSLSEDQKDLPRAIEYNRKSLALNPLGRIPYLNIANLQSALGHNDLATREFLKGISIHPEWPTVYTNLANHLQRLGRLDEALAWALEGSKRDNGPNRNFNIIGLQFELGMLEQALGSIQKLGPNNPAKAMFDAFLLVFDGQFEAGMLALESSYADREDAFPYVRRSMSSVAMLSGDLERISRYASRLLPPLDAANVNIGSMHVSEAMKMAYVWSKQGEVERATQMFEKILILLGDQPALGIAGHGIRDVQALAMLGRTDEAIAALTRTVADGFIGSVLFDAWELEDDPYLASIRSRPEYSAQLEIIKQKKATMRSNVEDALSANDWQALRQLASGD